MSPPNKAAPAMLRFELCDGRGLRICDSCKRLATEHPAAAANPHQPRIPQGADTGPRCSRWLTR
jgi:hypothetical protein